MEHRTGRMRLKHQILLAFAAGIGIASAAMLFDVGVDWMQTVLVDVY